MPFRIHFNCFAKPHFDATYIAPEKNGGVLADQVIECIQQHPETTGIVSIMHTNNETGVKTQGIDRIAEVCRSNGILFHTDCVQAVGCYEIDVSRLACDFLSISSHKIHGCKGIGALYIRDKPVMSPMIHGGKFQEYGLRGGTENVAGIVGFGEACRILRKNFKEDVEYVSRLRRILYDDIQRGLEGCGLGHILHVNGNIDLEEHGKTINLRFDNVDGETLLYALDSYDVCVSSGSACQAHESNPSHVLLAMGIDEEAARNSIRFSLSKMNSEKEVRDAAKIVVSCVKILHG